MYNTRKRSGGYIMAGLKLYEINSMIRDALDGADEKIDHVTGEIPEDWASFLEALEMERTEKCLAIAAVIREKLAYADAVKSEAKRLIDRARAEENKAESLKAYLSSAISVGEKLKDERVAISWRKSSSVVIDDESKLPESCFKVVRSVSKTEVKEALTSGALTDGAHIEEKQNIQIR